MDYVIKRNGETAQWSDCTSCLSCSVSFCSTLWYQRNKFLNNNKASIHKFSYYNYAVVDTMLEQVTITYAIQCEHHSLNTICEWCQLSGSLYWNSQIIVVFICTSSLLLWHALTWPSVPFPPVLYRSSTRTVDHTTQSHTSGCHLLPCYFPRTYDVFHPATNWL